MDIPPGGVGISQENGRKPTKRPKIGFFRSRRIAKIDKVALQIAQESAEIKGFFKKARVQREKLAREGLIHK